MPKIPRGIYKFYLQNFQQQKKRKKAIKAILLFLKIT